MYLLTISDIIEHQLDEKLYEEHGVQYLYRPVLYQDIPSITPSEKDLDYAVSWWKEQTNRCRHGWIAPDGHYLNPITYWYLNFCKASMIFNFKTKKVEYDVPPLYTYFMIKQRWQLYTQMQRYTKKKGSC